MMIPILFFSVVLINIGVNSFDPYEPPSNPTEYEKNTLINPANLFPLGGKIPSERVFQSLSISNSKSEQFIVLYGGYDIDGKTLGDINLYHIPSQQWSGPIIRKECCDNSGETVDIIGLQNPEFFKNSNFSYLKQGFEGDFPLSRAEHGSCSLNEKTFIFGGYNDKYGLLNDLYYFDATLLSWTLVNDIFGNIPRRRAGHHMVCDSSDNSLYIFGGRSLRRNSVIGLNDVWRFDTLSRTWTLLTDFSNYNGVLLSNNENNHLSPEGREHFAMSLIDQKLIIYGGKSPSSQLLFNDIWLFHTRLNYWEVLFQNQMIDNGFSPPPLSNAHIIPITLPLKTLKQTLSTPFNESVLKSILVYGGVGSGGSCGGKLCSPLQSSLGQVYKFSLDMKIWVDPHTFDGVAADSEMSFTQAFLSPTWMFSSLSTSTADFSGSNEVHKGKLIKNFAYEKLVFSPNRNLVFEFGGIKAIEPNLATDGQQSGIYTSSSNNVADSNEPPELESSGGILTTSYSDTLTGEQLRSRVDLPTNGYWSYDQLFNSSINNTIPSVINNQSILFLRVFRTYSISSDKIILIKEDLV